MRQNAGALRKVFIAIASHYPYASWVRLEISRLMSQPRAYGSCLPLPVPNDRIERTVLFAMRRMAAHGARDANAAWLMLDLFSVKFRRPLVLLRAFLLELAHVSQGPIRIAPCCTPRMTADEGVILQILFKAATDMTSAEDALVRLTRNSAVGEPLSAAAVFARATIELSGSVPAPGIAAS